MPNLGPQYDLAQRLTNLERQVQQLLANPLGQAFSMNQSDGSVGFAMGVDSTTGASKTTWFQGPNTGRDPNTELHPVLMEVSEAPNGTGGSTNAGVGWYYPNGNPGGVFAGQNGVAGGWQLYDSSGCFYPVFSTATLSPGAGLLDPYLPASSGVLMGSTYNTWPSVPAGSSSTALAFTQVTLYHYQLQVAGYTFAESGGSGSVYVQVQVSDPINGTTTVNGATHTASSNAYGSFSETITLPVTIWTARRPATITIVASASGAPVHAQLYTCMGVNNTY